MNNEITCTLNVLSRCHLTDKEWKPEDLSPLGLMALKTKLNARHRDEEIKAAPRVKDGYVKPQTWTAEQRRNLDHCHKTNVIRGFLCTRCNTILGLCDESATVLNNIKKYMSKHAER